MIKTIRLGSCVMVQGLLVRWLPDGRAQVRDGERIYSGTPVQPAA